MAPPCHVAVDSPLTSLLEDDHSCKLITQGRLQPSPPLHAAARGFCRSRIRPDYYPAQTLLWLPPAPSPTHRAPGFWPPLASLPLQSTVHPSPWLQLWGPPFTPLVSKSFPVSGTSHLLFPQPGMPPTSMKSSCHSGLSLNHTSSGKLPGHLTPFHLLFC